MRLPKRSNRNVVKFSSKARNYDFYKNHPKLNQDMQDALFSRANKSENINSIAKALTHFAFRNGPIETMHSKGQLSQEDMKILNKFMVNRLAYAFDLILAERWLEFQFLIDSFRSYGTGWDPVEPDEGDIPLLFEHFIDTLGKKEGAPFIL